MQIDMVIINAKIVKDFGLIEACIGINEGKIVSIAKESAIPKADSVLDAAGQIVLPGMVDMHVHFRDPGFTEREDFETGTKSAAAGGVTTVMDMPNTKPRVTSIEVLEKKKKIVGKKAVIDYALSGEPGFRYAMDGEPTFKENIPKLADEVVAFKVFADLVDDDGEIIEYFQGAPKDLPSIVHAEDIEIINYLHEIVGGYISAGKSRGIKSGMDKKLKRDLMTWTKVRPPISESLAIMRYSILANEASVPLHICHMAGDGVDYLKWAKGRGFNVTGETCPQYLTLTTNDVKKFGPYAKIEPPIKGKEQQEQLWQGLNDGTIDVLATDHAPYTREEKEPGWKDIFEANSGAIGVETALPLMLDCVNRELLTLQRLVKIFSENPARILGLYPRKGVLGVGGDADLVFIDMNREYEVKAENLHSKSPTTFFEGRRGKGVPTLTMVRGNVVMKEGEVIGKPGYGICLKRLR